MQKDWKDSAGEFLQGMADFIDRLSEPFFSFVAVVIPFISPVVIAQITASAMVVGSILNQTQANQLAFVLEGIGIVGLSGLVIAIDRWIRSKNEKMDSMILLLGTIDIIYFLFLVSVNVLLDMKNENITNTQIAVKVLICLVPLMSGGIFGYYRVIQKDKISKRESNKREYEIRQEEREDKLARYRIKHENSRNTSRTNTEVPEQFQNSNKTSRTTSETMGRPSIHQERAFEYMEQYYLETKQVPTFTEVMRNLNLPQSTASRLRDKWIESKRQ
jgi:uncharacterized membrane protein